MTNSQNNWFRIGCLFVLLIGFGARVYRLDHQSFWNDEGNSASLSSRSVQLIIEGTASDVHPPLYYLALRGWWPLAGQTDFSLRYLSVAAGLIQVAASIAIGRLWLSRNGAISLGLLIALSPPLSYYSQEARMYALLGAIATLSMLVLLKSMKYEVLSEGQRGRARFTLYTFSFALLTALGLYTHYVYPAVIAAQGLIVLMWFLMSQPKGQVAQLLQYVWRQGWPWLAAVGVAVLAYAPWIPIFLRTGSSTRAAGDAGFVDFFADSINWLVGGPNASLPNWMLIPLLLVVLGSIFVRQMRQKSLTVLIWLWVPIILMLFVGATDDNYQKFLTIGVPAFWLSFMISISWFIEAEPNWHEARYMIFYIMVTAFMIGPVIRINSDPEGFRDDYRSIVKLIEREERGNAAVILNAPNQWEVFTWYAGLEGPRALYPMPQNHWSDERRAAETEAILAEHDFVYALFWGFEGFDPNRIVERTLDEQAFKSTDEWYGKVRLVTYGVLGDFMPSETNPPDFELGIEFAAAGTADSSGMRLDEVELSEFEVRRGEVLGLALFWTGTQPIDTRYKVFVQLLNADGVLVAQRDSEPVGNLKPTDGWTVGEPVIDQHGLLIPADVPAGEYQLVVGLYEAFGENRRLTHGADNQDFIDLGTITLTR